MRTPLLAGNWKMNKLNSELAGFFESFVAAAELDRQHPADLDVLFAVAPTLLARSSELAMPRGIRIAAQNIHWESAGAFTGEVSAAMVKEVGATATLIGHSERRQYFGETDETVRKKTNAALTAGIMPIVCVGETVAERDAGQTAAVVSRQIRAGLEGVVDPKNLVLAYEPVWAIGTGRSASAAQAQEVHSLIRSLIAECFGRSLADAMRLLYGGSATPANVGELMTQCDIDGALVGGASLKPSDFAIMAKYVRHSRQPS